MTQRRLIAALLLLAYAVAATGLPLPAPQTKLPTTERFPCEDCSCGCSTAEYCWTRCCCHSLSERLAWAARQNVRPPEFVLSQARLTGIDVSQWSTDAAPRVVVVERAAAKPRACCRCRKPQSQTEKDSEKDPTDAPQTSWRAFACCGALQLWLSISLALPVESAQPAVQPTGIPTLPVSLPLAAAARAAPPTPPPEQRG